MHFRLIKITWYMKWRLRGEFCPQLRAKSYNKGSPCTFSLCHFSWSLEFSCRRTRKPRRRRNQAQRPHTPSCCMAGTDEATVEDLQGDTDEDTGEDIAAVTVGKNGLEADKTCELPYI
ncbi:hypothetical protein T265_04237 [Opisthorchis viverrini]|uniref:Uncharacterized protein n=1 Tax=Opisthorchis viverrini TaxID=6198 RepID=A0A074ZPL7_OPIVI|nr:hypothetical protein T265_04237 [Opisthorchis viverrini]KER29051.1 hypothetical protein T265_04237 [Opisthorchis viverrini]